MKKISLLFLISSLLIVSCSENGQEIKKEKAQEIAAEIDQATDNVEVIKHETKVDYYYAETKTTETRSYTYIKNEKGEVHITSNQEMVSEISRSDFYIVEHAEYEKVIYLKQFRQKPDSKAEEEVSVYTKKDDPTFDTLAATYANAATQTASPYYKEAAYATKVMALNTIVENIKLKYYSSGAGNLTIEIDASKMVDDKGETPKSAKLKYVYNKNLLSTYEFTTVLKNGDKASLSLNCEYDETYKISLPAGWEKNIVSIS